MKVCPVCNETFADEMKFCDLDGTRLARQAEATGAPAHHRTWSLLGIGLLVGALVLSAVSVFMIPRARPLPSASNSSSSPAMPAVSKPADSGNSPSAGDSAAAPASDQPEVVAEAPPADATTKKKDKVKPITENEATPALNPKAAAQADEDAAKPETPIATPAATTKRAEPAPAPKPVSETREPSPAPKPVAAPDPKKDPKHQGDSAKDGDKKKADDKDKKKGGFFKVFKKIFGKD